MNATGPPLRSSPLVSKPLNHQMSPSKDTFLIFITFTLVAVCSYVTFYYFWKKHRKNFNTGLYKIEEYRYSRLNQSENEVDHSVIYAEPCATQLDEFNDNDEMEVKPATLQLETITDSLIAISNSQSDRNYSFIDDKNNSSKEIINLSDEDLLQ